uniref:Beta-1,4-galactosyltransferase n=1 Tax=Nothobranchius furzeri TaxID=105023 RepID=A0A8C6M7T7_NOTFU
RKPSFFSFLVLYSLLCVLCFSMFLFYRRGCPSGSFKERQAENTKTGFFWRIKERGQKNKSPEVQVKSTAGEEPLESCPETPPGLLGPLQVEFETNRTLENVRKQAGSSLQWEGRYKPPDCISKQKVAIIIPFRNRHDHLTHWIYYLHPILQRQQLHHGVFVINQHGDGEFNKAKLMNAGHVEALKEDDYGCFIFSDVDMVPLDDRNLYRCFDRPRHFSVAVDKFNYELPYKQIFGGVTAFSKEQFLMVNGFSNTYWGWGGEDDDMYKRVMFHLKSISRPDAVIGRYKMIRHERDHHNEQNLKNVKVLYETKTGLDQDGLSSLRYSVTEITKNVLFTFITVDVHVAPGQPAG